MQHKARKRFGQNFLQSPAIIGQILAAVNPQISDNLLEIGPGLGALTQVLLTKLDKLTAVEIDRDLQVYLEEHFFKKNFSLVKKDALELDYDSFGEELRIVGNLPYNVSVPLIMHCLKFHNSIKDMHFMVQKEVAKRFTANPGTKDYGRVTVMTKYHCELQYLFDVPPEVFNPQPKVDSAFIRFIPYVISPYSKVDFPTFAELLTAAFSMRRKTLFNNLKDRLTRSEFITFNLDPESRAEQISVEEFVSLANYLSNRDK